MPLAVISDSDDSSSEDIFMQNGGVQVESMYSTAPSGTANSYYNNCDDMPENGEDEEDEEPILITPKVKKRHRGRVTKSHSDKLSNEDKEHQPKESKKPKKKNASVFDVSSGDEEVQIVSPTPRIVHESADLEAKKSLASARAILAMHSEYRISQEAEEAARQDVEQSERLRKQERQKKNVSNIVKSPPRVDTSAIHPIVLKVRYEKFSSRMKIRSTDSILKMLKPFCQKYNLDHRKFVMECDGDQVTETDTPEGLELEDDMVIDIFQRGSR